MLGLFLKFWKNLGWTQIRLHTVINNKYCKWCYVDGKYTYNDMNTLIDVCVKHMVNENFTEEQARAYMKELLPNLEYWKK